MLAGASCALAAGLLATPASARVGRNTEASAMTHSRQSLPWCADTTGVMPKLVHGKLMMVVTRTDSAAVAYRAALANQPRLGSTDVTWIVDGVQCEAASRMLDSVVFERAENAPVYLHRIGSRRATGAANSPYMVISDSTFVPLVITEF